MQKDYRPIIFFIYFIIAIAILDFSLLLLVELLLIVVILKATSYINATNYKQTIFNQLNIMVPYVDIIGLCHSVAIL